ncbi:unnamed protein product [Ambrosiozyma monospora]|uniref:Unnamed protein product n=1 Tax=Ambrosiozyma monospora TaxID=43982 RepID=A0A9W6YPL7_AMBMO|nr:unnamed protein product [Ambrosiozyma monospora]
MLTYSIDTDSWSVPLQHPPDSPEMISRHAACLSDDKKTLFVSGGFNNNIKDEPTDNLYCFDFKSGDWSKKKFINRFDHFIFNAEDEIWSFGGLSQEMNHVVRISNFNLKSGVTGELNFSNLPKLHGNPFSGASASHCYLQISNTKILDILVPAEYTQDSEAVKPMIGYFDLTTLKYTYLISGSTFKPLVSYIWKHCFIYEDHLCMLGYPTSDSSEGAEQYKLSYLLRIPLTLLGLSEPAFQNSTNDDLMLSNFYKMYFSSEFTDFEIFGLNGDRLTGQEDETMDEDADEANKSEPIEVHKLVLMVRWPYFKKLYESGMTESQTNKMFIHEPVYLVKMLVDFLYTNTVKENISIETITKLLSLSEMYQITDLKSLLLARIYSEGFICESILTIWETSLYINDPILRMNSENFIFRNWGRIVRTEEFKDLSKEHMIQLFENLGEGSQIVAEKSSNSSFENLNFNNRNYESPVAKRQRISNEILSDDGGSSTSEVTTPVPGHPLTPTSHAPDGLRFMLEHQGSTLSHHSEAPRDDARWW